MAKSPKTDADRRAERRRLGFNPHEIWCRDVHWNQIKTLVSTLAEEDVPDAVVHTMAPRVPPETAAASLYPWQWTIIANLIHPGHNLLFPDRQVAFCASLSPDDLAALVARATAIAKEHRAMDGDEMEAIYAAFNEPSPDRPACPPVPSSGVLAEDVTLPEWRWLFRRNHKHATDEGQDFTTWFAGLPPKHQEQEIEDAREALTPEPLPMVQSAPVVSVSPFDSPPTF